MIILRDITLTFGPRTLFNAINANFNHNQKIGLIGRNGTGKSTLLKVIGGDQQLDDGAVDINKKKTFAYMPQEVILESNKTVLEEVSSVFQQFIDMQKECIEIEDKLEKQMGDPEALIERYTTLQEKLTNFDAASAQTKIERILNGLGFSDKQKQKKVSQLSVGWKMRIVLAKLLLQDADFYLFDEPTNHLDMVTKEWFLQFLRNGNFGYLLVSHDRYFLDEACDYIFELERGNGTMYNGNFSKYVYQKEHNKEMIHAAHTRQQKEIARKQKTIDRFRASATKAKMVKSMMKQIDKMEKIEIEPALPSVNFSFPASIRPGKTILTVKNLGYRFGDKQLFQNASCYIMRGQKIALVAPNGTGKTTLFNVLVGKYPIQEGEVIFGHNVEPAFFEQDQLRALNPNNTIWQEVINACPQISEAKIRSFLGTFLFKGDDIHKKISVLSGGERNRVAMVKVLLAKANFLLLDEPTNHLDLYTKDILLQALKQYEGTILMVSHDHDFMQKLATDVFELNQYGITHFPGSYETYLYERKPDELAPTQEDLVAAKPIEKKENKLSKEQKKIVAKLEEKIEKLEKRKEKINFAFTSLTYGTIEYDKKLDELKQTEQELIASLKEWEERQIK